MTVKKLYASKVEGFKFHVVVVHYRPTRLTVIYEQSKNRPALRKTATVLALHLQICISKPLKLMI